MEIVSFSKTTNILFFMFNFIFIRNMNSVVALQFFFFLVKILPHEHFLNTN